MAGDDEARARATLAEMQLRISQGPTSALGIGEIVTPDEVRTAFLALTKQFHPARFGRLSPELQKLATEVFLGIKGAHDHMLKVLGTTPASSRGGARAPAPVSPASRGTLSLPRLEAPSPPALARGTDRGPGAATRTSSIPLHPRTSTGQVPIQGTTKLPRLTGQVPIQRPLTPVPPGTQPGVGVSRAGAPLTPPTQPPRASVALKPPTQPPRGAADSFNPPTIRGLQPPATPTQQIPRVGAFDEAAAFRECAALLEQKNWAAARQALHTLVVRVPQSKPYRAWLCYARGREAYLHGRPDEAIVEMQRALDLQPDLAHARHALTELQRRR